MKETGRKGKDIAEVKRKGREEGKKKKKNEGKKKKGRRMKMGVGEEKERRTKEEKRNGYEGREKGRKIGEERRKKRGEKKKERGGIRCGRRMKERRRNEGGKKEGKGITRGFRYIVRALLSKHYFGWDRTTLGEVQDLQLSFRKTASDPCDERIQDDESATKSERFSRIDRNVKVTILSFVIHPRVSHPQLSLEIRYLNLIALAMLNIMRQVKVCRDIPLRLANRWGKLVCNEVLILPPSPRSEPPSTEALQANNAKTPNERGLRVDEEKKRRAQVARVRDIAWKTNPFVEIPSGESKVHIEVLSVLWGNRLPILDGSLPLSSTQNERGKNQREYWRQELNNDSYNDTDEPILDLTHEENPYDKGDASEDLENFGNERMELIIMDCCRGSVRRMIGSLARSLTKTIWMVLPGESYTKVRVLEIKEMPRTSSNIATVKAELMKEMGTAESVQRET
ncbi:hypothetical protein Tco_1080665 [Tanacetum coccineum]|uniref:Uncharacterized protein n=1 Tax=Tanacetum coccineum TaxID=301880 RepID=A0ABQ5HVT6_9ASTR